MWGQDLVAARGAKSDFVEDIISVRYRVSLVACLIHQSTMVSHLDLVEALKVQGSYGGDAAMNEVNILDNNSMLASRRPRCQPAIQAYIRVRLVIFKQVYRTSQSAEKRKIQKNKNKDAVTLVCNYLLYWRSTLV